MISVTGLLDAELEWFWAAVTELESSGLAPMIAYSGLAPMIA